MWECFCECRRCRRLDERIEAEKEEEIRSSHVCLRCTEREREREREHCTRHQHHSRFRGRAGREEKEEEEGSFQSGDIINNACRHLSAFLSVLTSCFWFCCLEESECGCCWLAGERANGDFTWPNIDSFVEITPPKTEGMFGRFPRRPSPSEQVASSNNPELCILARRDAIASRSLRIGNYVKLGRKRRLCIFRSPSLSVPLPVSHSLQILYWREATRRTHKHTRKYAYAHTARQRRRL